MSIILQVCPGYLQNLWQAFSVYSGVSVYFATEQYIVHSLNEG